MARQEDGFTLIEIIVAIVVLSSVVVALLEGLSLGWRGARTAEMELAALSVAKARLASAGIETPLQEGRWTGTAADGFRWVVTAVREPAQDAPAAAPARYWVTVEVAWRAGPWSRTRSLELATLKLGAAP
ncbi:MAG: prepilin-type N-terminal cleavage/methylation domain-containing protein [Hyphomicrobiaceae bacterium]|nr:prepilin-type N-terminal cleavage/methylation domain-containing protein [Hyphomicrobiaceae bacterium]